jgi:hypothetical protein
VRTADLFRNTNGDFEPPDLDQNEYASMGWSTVSGSK